VQYNAAHGVRDILRNYQLMPRPEYSNILEATNALCEKNVEFLTDKHKVAIGL